MLRSTHRRRALACNLRALACFMAALALWPDDLRARSAPGHSRVHEEFVRTLRSVEPNAQAKVLEERATELAKLPDAAASFLEIRAADARAGADGDPASPPTPLSSEQREVLARVAPRLPRDEVLACIGEGAKTNPDTAWREAALDLLRGHAASSELSLLVDLVRDPQGHLPREGALVDRFQDAFVEIVRRDASVFGRLDWLAETAGPLRESVVHALGIAGDPEALSWLVRRLRDPDLSGVALQEIGRLAPQAAPDRRAALAAVVRPYLRSPQAAARSHAIRAIVALRDSKAVPVLIEILEKGERGERKTALAALRSLTGNHLPDRASDWRQWHAAELAWIEKEAPPVLEELRSENEAEVVAAVRVLAQHGLDRDRLAAGLARLLREHASPAVRGQVCLALERLGSPTGLDELAATLDDPDPAVGGHALKALRSITGLSLPWDARAWRTAVRSLL